MSDNDIDFSAGFLAVRKWAGSEQAHLVVNRAGILVDLITPGMAVRAVCGTVVDRPELVKRRAKRLCSRCRRESKTVSPGGRRVIGVEEPATVVPARLAEARQARGWTQEQLADAAIRDAETIRRAEDTGDGLNHSNVAFVADLLGVSRRWLLGRETATERLAERLRGLAADGG